MDQKIMPKKQIASTSGKRNTNFRAVDQNRNYEKMNKNLDQVE